MFKVVEKANVLAKCMLAKPQIVHTPIRQVRPMSTLYKSVVPTTYQTTRVQMNNSWNLAFSRSFKNNAEDNDFDAPSFEDKPRSFERRGRRDNRNNKQKFQPRVTKIVTIRGMFGEKASEDQIRQTFSQFEIAPNGITILRDPVSQIPSGIIFVEFVSEDVAAQAISWAKEQSVSGERIACHASSEEERDAVIEDHKQPSQVITCRVPFQATEQDMLNLFDGFHISNMVVGHGAAFIKFSSAEEAQTALQKQGLALGNRQVFPKPSIEFDLRRAKLRPVKVLKARGAPRDATESDYRTLFDGLTVTRVVSTFRDKDGTTVNGPTFVEFATEEELNEALKRDRQKIGERYVLLNRSSPKERNLALNPREPGSYGNNQNRGGRSEF